jgi:hypothetical protein
LAALFGLGFAGGVVKVKELDWLKADLCTGLFLLCPFDFIIPHDAPVSQLWT